MAESVEDLLDPVSDNASENEVANRLVNDAIEAAVLQVTDDTSTSSEDDEFTPDPDILCSETVSAPVIERADDDNKSAEGNIAPGECINYPEFTVYTGECITQNSQFILVSALPRIHSL